MKMVPKNTKTIIMFLLRSFDEKNINEISKELKISIGSAFNILKKLERQRIVVLKKMGNASYYSLNFHQKETINLCEFILLQEKQELKGYARAYFEEISKFNYSDLIILFGSVLNNDKFNDVDVLFVTNNVKKVNEFCIYISKLKTKPVVPLILRERDLINELKSRKDSILEIIKKGVVVKGEGKYLEVIKNAKSG